LNRYTFEFWVRGVIIAAALLLSLAVFVIGIFAAIFSQGCGALCSEPDHPSVAAFLAAVAVWGLVEYAIYARTRMILRALEVWIDSRP
jgi:Mg2+/Co2+ transporter CorB